MKKILAAGALFLSASLASDTIFGFITDPACGPCLHQVVANGPGSTQSKEFASYLCLGEGGSAIAVCITECGSMSPMDDPVDIAAVEGQIYLIMGAVFDYCFAYYPEETCRALKDVFGGALDEVCSGVGTGGNNNSQSSARGTAMRSSAATIGSTAARTAAAGTAATGTAAAGTAATGTAATGTAAAGTAAAGTAAAGTAATGSRQTQTPSSAAAASVLTPWEMLIGLVMLAVNI